MRDLSTLLSIARWWCGSNTASRVFEPLLADWQHDLEAAGRRGGARYAAALLFGMLAYARSLARCTLSRGWLPTWRATENAAVATFFALDAAFFVLWVLGTASTRNLNVDAIQQQYFLLGAAAVAVPPVLLPALFLMRRDQRSTPRHAATAIVIGASLTAVVVTLTTPERLNALFSSFKAFESRHQRTLANDSAGRVTYPGTAVRQLAAPTTIEQRRERYEQFMAWRGQQEAKRPPLPWSQLARRYYPVPLSILFGMIGWTLGGLAAPTYWRAAMWWSLMFAATIAFGVRPMTVGLPSIGRIPSTMAMAFFAAVATALILASWRRPTERGGA